MGYRTVRHWHQSVAQSADFAQYYMGGLIARSGAWEALYPIPLPESHSNPGDWTDSTPRPRYAQLADQAGVGPQTARYIQPPPFALLLIPLSLLPYPASFALWTLLLIAASWGIGVQAGRVYIVSLGREDRLAGMITLLVCISPQAHRWVRVANMSAIIGWLMGLVLLELIKLDSIRGAIAMTLGAIAKYAVIVLTPLHIIRGRWLTLARTAGMMAALLLLTLATMGIGPWRVFVSEILPTLGRSKFLLENQSLYAFFLRISGTTDELALPAGYVRLFHALQILSLLIILTVIVIRRKDVRTEARQVFAAALALLGWLLIFSPIFWEHYHAYLGPLWGWLIAEATRSRTRMIASISAIVLTYVPWTVALRHWHFTQPPEPFCSHLLWATVLMSGLGVWSLIRRGDKA